MSTILVGKAFRVYEHTAVGASHTGDTNETALATITIPANLLGANGRIRVIHSWNFTGTSSKTLRVRLGGIAGTAFNTVATSTNLAHQYVTQIANRNDTASQIGGGALSTGNPFTGGGAALVTGTVDTTAAQDLVLSGQLADGGGVDRLRTVHRGNPVSALN